VPRRVGCEEGVLPSPPVEGSVERAQGLCHSPENFGTFSLEMAHFSANCIVYFNRNVRQFTTGTTTVTCIHVLPGFELSGAGG